MQKPVIAIDLNSKVRKKAYVSDTPSIAMKCKRVMAVSLGMKYSCC